MSDNPIIDEVRKAREEIAAECNYDLSVMVAESQRRTLEAQRNGRTVIFPPKRPSAPAEPPPDEHRIAG